MTDQELLNRYTHEHSQSAFTELVRRHVNLVYSAARRQVGSRQLAEEISQSVFLDLARNAGKFDSCQPISAWLYVVTRRTAVDVLRRETRRQTRERIAAEFTAMQTPSDTWPKVEALIDEAMEKLSDSERTALVLRFFENLDLHEVGASLGISEDAAQKRVSRALERLRRVFAARGVAVASAALATDLSAHAASAAPSGLVAAIASSTSALPASAVGAVKQLAMTTAQKILATAAVTAALGFAFYEGNAAVRLHGEVSAGQQGLDRLADTARQLRLERDVAARQLASLNQGRSAAQPEPGSDDALAQEAAAWFARIAQLKQTLVQHPELNIPELQLLPEREWLRAAHGQNYSREENVLKSLRFLRSVAKGNFIERVSDAAHDYFASTKTWPTQFDQLAPLLTPPVDPAILARYDFQNEGDRLIIAEKLAGAVDLDQLALCIWENAKPGLYGSGVPETAPGRTVREAAQAYAKAHDGARATDPAQLRPFLSQPLDDATLAKLFQGLPLTHQPRPATAAP